MDAIFVLAIVAVMLYSICRAVRRVEGVEGARQAVSAGLTFRLGAPLNFRRFSCATD